MKSYNSINKRKKTQVIESDLENNKKRKEMTVKGIYFRQATSNFLNIFF